MAKKVRKKTTGLTRKQRSRLEQEKRLEQFLLWGVTIVVVAIVGILGYGLVFEKLIKAREPVAMVGNTPIITAEFQARVRFMRMQMQRQLFGLQQRQAVADPTDPNSDILLQYLQEQIRSAQTDLAPENTATVGDQVISQLILEELVRQEAERRGIIITQDELQKQIESNFGYDSNPPTPEPTVSSPLTPTEESLPTPTPMTEKDFEQLYADFLSESLKPLDISEEQYRSWLEASLLSTKLQEQMATEISTEADQVELNVLSVNSNEQASALVARLDAGEDFQILAAELNAGGQDSGYATELGWLPKDLSESNLGAELTEIAFNLEVGEHSQPVADPDGGWYNILKVEGHESREIDQWAQQQLAEQKFQGWLESQQFLVERRTYLDRVPTEP